MAADVRAVLRRALALEPAERYPSSEALRRELAALRRTRPSVSLPELGAWVRTRLGVTSELKQPETRIDEG